MKEVFGIDAAVLHGDICSHLQGAREFDIIWASGVLYHQTDPLEMLRLCSERANNLYVWTHYCDDECLGGHGFDVSKNTWKDLKGHSFEYHYRSYDLNSFEEDITPNWSAGTAPYANWIRRSDLLRALDLLGYSKIELEVDGPRLSNLPVISFFASKGL